jgi:fluoroacetyl-CoA thioesterase
MKPTLVPGIEHMLRFRVTDSKTVPALYAESEEFRQMPAVFATGYLVALLEWACIQAVDPHLDSPSELTLGVHIDVSHVAATPPGFEVTVHTKLIEVTGRRLVFKVWAHDGIETISEGTHERRMVDRVRFDDRVEAKRRQTA